MSGWALMGWSTPTLAKVVNVYDSEERALRACRGQRLTTLYRFPAAIVTALWWVEAVPDGQSWETGDRVPRDPEQGVCW